MLLTLNYKTTLITTFQVLSVFISILIAVVCFTNVKRKLIGTIQKKRGPNIISFFKLLNSLAESLKLFFQKNSYYIEDETRTLIFISVASLLIWSTSSIVGNFLNKRIDFAEKVVRLLYKKYQIFTGKLVEKNKKEIKKKIGIPKQKKMKRLMLKVLHLKINPLKVKRLKLKRKTLKIFVVLKKRIVIKNTQKRKNTLKKKLYFNSKKCFNKKTN